MKVRIYNVKDESSVNTLLNEYDMSCADDCIKLVAEDDNETIRGICAIRFVPMIEPLVANNPKAGTMLFTAAEELLKQMNSKIVRAFCDKSYVELFSKVGFERVFSGEIIMEKILTEKES